MYAFIPRSLCALRRVASRSEHCRFGATQGIRLTTWGPHLTAEATDGRRALMVQTLLPPAGDVPWPAFKELPDDAGQTIVDPKDLERAAKLGGELLKINGNLGVATVGANVSLGLGSDIISTRCLDGRFPDLKNVIPKGAPLFTFRVDAKLLADTLLAFADMLPETERGVQLFFYGTNQPIGLCARSSENGLLIDGLFLPMVTNEKKEDTDEPAGAAGAGQDEDADDEPDPDAEPQEEEEGDEEPDAETEEAEAEPAPEPEPVKPKQRRSRKAKASSA